MAYLVTLVVFAMTLVNQPLQSGGWYWDAGNAFGFLGFAGLLYLFLDVGFSRRHRIHKYLSYGFATSLGIHILWLWINDPTIWHYVTLDASLHMLLGLFSIAVVIVMIVLALPSTRRYWHGNFAQFRSWHYIFSLFAVVSAYWHIVGSGFYVSTVEAGLLLALICTIAILHRQQTIQLSPTSHIRLLALPSIAILFVGLKWAGGQYLATLATTQ